ncbi:MAG: 16S rRNA (cytosine(1402)-N(4))-methyltransferase RsmH [Lachnospiraceae bacterium]|nr:16S rRNA (cytosine(1402)-N(4))-methyltransferase RsmH [Lachnospiraceae bacterium]
MDFEHVSVLLNETVDALVTDPDGIYADGTLGGGGHSLEVCRRLSDKGRLIGIDQDADAIAAARERLKPFGDRVTILRCNYSEMCDRLSNLGISRIDGILLDLGVSSYQLDEPSRGFAYREENAPLDMRMDCRQSRTARDILETYSEQELYRVIRDYGEERFAKNIAKHIAAARKVRPIETTGELNEIIRAAIPAKVRAAGGHPSKRTYQAIRIELNRELEVLADSLDGMIDRLKPGGRLCVITFHSIEDRIVKTNFKRNENPCTCPDNFPVCVCGKVSKGKMLTRKPILPSEEEMEHNKRAKSAKLRVFEKARDSVE